MSRSTPGKRFESNPGILFRIFRFSILAVSVAFLCFTGVLDLTWQQQAIFGGLTVLIAIWMNRTSTSYLVTLTLMFVSMYSTFRYGVWRITTTTHFFADPASKWDLPDAFFIWLLLAAEIYAFMILFLGYMQTLWPLRRMPVPLPDDIDEWPVVDLLIPTFNEPLSVVRYTALAAMNIDWPPEKLGVYILDDGRREEFRAFAEDAGIGYMSREDNEYAKAGNINHALKHLKAPYVTIFDCDHVPTRSFLQVTMGWFLRDRRLGMLQTPHHFYSPDPFERNLSQFRMIPNEGELFYGVVQDGNDFWNATFFCGSCAVLRRSALDEIGGVATETVTEDAHTSLRMQRNGWNTAYINIPQAAGLATESLGGHIRQRIRWARGMIQILRTDNPLFTRGLKLAQRLCYFNAMSHFLFAMPRLVFLTAPLIYLILGHVNVPGYWATIFVFALPHLILSSLTNSRIQGQHRYSFWNEIYETILAPYLVIPSFLAFINPKLGKFDVTPKGGVVRDRFFDAKIARPFLFMLAVDLIGLLMGVPRYFYMPVWPLRYLYDPGHTGTIVLNMIWTLFNIVILGVCTAVSWESQQRRATVRVSMAVPADLILADGSLVEGVTADMSSGGVQIKIDEGVKIAVGEFVQLVFAVLEGEATIPATVVGAQRGFVRARFDPLTLQEEEALTMVLYSRADSWLGLGETHDFDRPLKSLGRILQLSLWGFSQLFVGAWKAVRPNAPRTPAITRFVPVIVLACLFGASVRSPGAAQIQDAAPPVAERSFQSVYKLSDMGIPVTRLNGIDGRTSVHFVLPSNAKFKTAVMHLRYRFWPGFPGPAHLTVSLNGKTFASIPVTSRQQAVAALTLPAEQLAHDNELTFEFVSSLIAPCGDPFNAKQWVDVDGASTVEIAGAFVTLQNELKQLPLPFYDEGIDQHPVIPIVFLGQPSTQALQAAGIVSSWFGVLTKEHTVRFPVSLLNIPPGNAIVFAEDGAALAKLNLAGSSGAAISMQPNPVDPDSKLLVISGDNGADLVKAATLLATSSAIQGDHVTVTDLKRPAPRQPDDAPRWAGAAVESHHFGTASQEISLRMPPDLYFGTRQDLALRLRVEPIPPGTGEMLQVFMNGSLVSSTGMPHKAGGESIVPIPIGAVRPYSNSVKMTLIPQTTSKGPCVTGAPTGPSFAITGTPHLDIRGIPHLATLPNLEAFADAGYPFTRMADLFETAIVMPDVPKPAEIELFLALMGHFGGQTGYPALNVTVAGPAGLKSDSGKDYLVLGTQSDQPAIRTLNGMLPVSVEGDGLHLADPRGLAERLRNIWASVRLRRSPAPPIAGGIPDAVVEEAEWPKGSQHSVVLIALRDQSMVPALLGAYLENSRGFGIAQNVSVLRGGRFTSYQTAAATYHVGPASPMLKARLLISQLPWLFSSATILISFLVAVFMRGMLRRKARLRLLGID